MSSVHESMTKRGDLRRIQTREPSLVPSVPRYSRKLINCDDLLEFKTYFKPEVFKDMSNARFTLISTTRFHDKSN